MLCLQRANISRFNALSSCACLMSSQNKKPPFVEELKSQDSEIKITGLAKALGKFRELEKIPEKEVKKTSPPKSFLSLLRHSRFVQLGDPRGKVLVGKIFKVVNDDLYIDFGGKFYCVCRRPSKNSEVYIRGAKVRIRLNEFEMAARFMGAIEDLTLLEAHATLLGILWSPFGNDRDTTQQPTELSAEAASK